MTEERTTPLRERMLEDMRIHGMGEKAQKAHIRAVKHFADAANDRVEGPDRSTAKVGSMLAIGRLLLRHESHYGRHHMLMEPLDFRLVACRGASDQRQF